MAKVIRVHQLGGPEVLQIEEMTVGDPGPGEVRIRVEAVGLNRSEAMYRAGRYPVTPQLPSLIGYEGVGTIEAVGAGVAGYKEGDRVCVLPTYRLGEYGVYAQVALVPARSSALVPLRRSRSNPDSTFAVVPARTSVLPALRRSSESPTSLMDVVGPCESVMPVSVTLIEYSPLGLVNVPAKDWPFAPFVPLQA